MDKGIQELVEEWHETKSISTATEVCERIWEAIHAGEENNG